jgi:hypothetical protein
VIFIESHISKVAFPEKTLWKFLGNRLVKSHVGGNTKAIEAELVEIGISFVVLP